MKTKESRPALIIPPDLKAALARNKSAAAVFDALAYTHRKEHIQALLEARRAETRERRLAKTMEMLGSAQPARANVNSSRSAVEKMRIQPGDRVAVLHADAEASKLFDKLPKGAQRDAEGGKGSANVVVLFAETAAQLAKRLPAAIKAGAPGATLWVGFPKLSSGRSSTLTRDIGWDAMEARGLTAMTLIALNDTWSGVKYRLPT
ncbi:MAG: YdeI/OmpD-associated family protein [Gemmatimonadota bacterium]